MPDNFAAARSIKQAAVILKTLPTIGANAYANGINGAVPIVRQHFTKGNQQRYGWAPLSKDYAAEKAGKTTKLKANIRQSGRVVPKGKQLPMLVASGQLRDDVSNKANHRIAQTNDVAIITFGNLPEYAEFLQDGTDKMPARSPVDPNESDAKQVADVMLRYLSSALGTGSPAVASINDGRARVV